MKRILLISGNSHIQKFFGEFLHAQGYDIEVAESEHSGAEFLKFWQVSLVINDLGIKNDAMSLDLIDTWNTAAVSQSLPTIFLVENASPSTKDFVQQASNCWLLLKPCDEKDLLDPVAEVIGI